MPEVTLMIGGRPHMISCRAGEEARFESLGAMLDQRWPVALRAAGNAPGERAMLFVALMLADAYDEAENRPLPEGMMDEAMLAKLADRLERLADVLEGSDG